MTLPPLAAGVSEARGWDNVMRHIMLAGKHLPVLPESLRSAGNKIAGCQSNVWLDVNTEDGTSPFLAWSDSKVIRGLLAVMLEKAALNGPLTIAEWQEFLQQAGLERYLSESRTSGLRYVIAALADLK